ncbi:MAG: choline-sulfatase, partial [Caldilineaceae bacterium]|nr:choline-sulfatase [Caldilineaceae bacterium]
MAAKETQPNILIIQADQCAPQALPIYGHPLVKAPNLAALGNAGVVFENAYCNSPLCAPSRFSMLTGQLPSRTGVYDNAAEMPSHVPTFAHYLRNLGYQTILCGKMHFVGADQLHGFEERLTTDIYPADFTWTPDWEQPERILEWYHNMFSVVTAGQCAAANDLDYDDEVAFNGVRKIYDLARSADERPFCMVVSFTHPHDPFLVRPEHWQRYREDEIDMPAVQPPFEELDAHSRRLLDCFAIDEYEITEAHVRAARHAYYAAISYIDDKVGELMHALRAAGYGDNTIVIFTSDHGEMLGEHRLWYKMSWYEWSARVPLLVHAPARFAPQRLAQPVSLLDLLPTLVDMATDGAGSALADPVDGDSLLPLLRGQSVAWSDRAVVGEYLAECVAAPSLMIRQGRHKFIHCPTDPDQLYDLENDPNELTNLVAAPAQQDVVAAFRAAVVTRWAVPTLRRQVVASQRRRHLVANALLQGKPTYWDYQPKRDASQEYVRNHMEFWELYRRTRLPQVEPPQPQRAVTRHANL